MRSILFVSLLLAATVPAAAQTGSQPNLVLTIFGGTVLGHALWTVDRQPVSVLDGSGRYDTLQLSRSINASVVLGASGTYFPSPHVGLHVEVSYMGLPIDSDCTAVFLNPDTLGSGGTDTRRNGQMCDEIRSQSGGGGAIAVFGGVTLRAGSRRAFSPYVRGNVGLVNLSRSTIEVVGAYADGGGAVFERQVVADQSPRRTSLLLGASVGFTTPLGPGYQFRMEVRDFVTPLDRLSGPANGLAIAPQETRWYHHFALTLGLDVVMEKSRGRRY